MMCRRSATACKLNEPSTKGRQPGSTVPSPLIALEYLPPLSFDENLPYKKLCYGFVFTQMDALVDK